MNDVTEERRGGTCLLSPAPLAASEPAEPRLAALDAALERALADADVRAVLLICPADALRTGPDLDSVATLRRLCGRIDGAGRCVIAVLEGQIQGDMAELALAAHYRAASSTAQIRFPGLLVGVPPRAGATQRLPRHLGAAATLAFFLGAQSEAIPRALLDAPPDDDALAAALSLAEAGPPPRPTDQRIDGFSDPAGFMAEVAQIRSDLPEPAAVSERIVECVEASILLPLDGGLEMEAAAFRDCAHSGTARALSRLAEAELNAWNIPEAGTAPWPEIGRVAILGGTPLAASLVFACLEAGLETRLVELDPKGQAAVLEQVLAVYEDLIAENALTEEARDRRLALLGPEARFEDLADVDVVWEAAVESIELKTELWRAVGLLAAPGAVLLSGGDTLPLAVLADAAGRENRILGLHMAWTRHNAPLVELVLPAKPASGDVAGALALVRRLGKRVVRSVDHPGFVVHRLRTALEHRIEALLIAGAEAEAVDDALMAWGFRASPCYAMDIEGLDRILARRRRIAGRGTPAAAEFSLLDALVETGLTGREEGAGLMSWADGAPAGDDAESRAVMRAVAEAKGIQPAQISADRIQRACLAALANAGAHMLTDGTVPSAGEVDVAATAALGFPRVKGGPMAAADLAGLIAVENDLAIAPDETPVSQLFDTLIKQGRGFTDRA